MVPSTPTRPVLASVILIGLLFLLAFLSERRETGEAVASPKDMTPAAASFDER